METIATQISDHDVVNRVLNGEKELYEVIIRRNNQLLYRVIRGYLSEEQDVEDAMQDTYLQAYEKLNQFRGEAAFSTWLLRIGINEALKRIRGLKKQQVMRSEEKSLQDDLIQIPDKMNPEKKAMQFETRRLIEKAIDQLPEKYRTVFILREVEEMNIDDTAACLRISSENVKVRAHRAKMMLKEALYDLSYTAEVFEFGTKRCDALTANVMGQILKIM